VNTEALTLTLAVTLALTASGPNWASEASEAADPTAGARDALRAALQLRDVPLTVHASCRHAGPDPADRTIGDYLSGLLAAMEQPSNTVQARCEPGPGRHRTCTVWLKHRDDEERWAWGLAFEIDARHRPLWRSVRCLGAG